VLSYTLRLAQAMSGYCLNSLKNVNTSATCLKYVMPWELIRTRDRKWISKR
jgi:hypothetical protein